ncbi:MAG: hypothetical protein AAGA03_17820, partial [Planctomycetota bacterium]
RLSLVALVVLLILGFARLRLSDRSEPEFSATAHRGLLNATIGRVFDTTAIGKREPTEQFAYWHPRIHAVLEAHPDDAELHAAAALIFDKPSDQMSQLAGQKALERQSPKRPNAPDIYSIAADAFATIYDWTDSFDQQATPVALRLSDRAIELEPSRAAWLRLRAAISCPPSLYRENSIDRSGRLAELADLGSRVDPRNGIYRLLLASEQLESYVSRGSEQSNWQPELLNQEAAVKTVQDALAATELPTLEIGEPGSRGLRRLHALAGHPVCGTLESLQSHSTSLRAQMHGVSLVRLCLAAGDASVQTGQLTQAVFFYEAADSLVRALQQKAGEPFFARTELYTFREIARREIVGVVAKQRGTEIDRRKAVESLNQASSERIAFEAALANLARQKTRTRSSVIAWTIVAASQNVIFALMIGVPLLGMAWLLAGRPCVVPSPLSWSIAVVASLVLVAILYGVGPAGVVNETWQGVTWLVAVSLLMLALIVGCIRLSHRAQFRLRTLLAGCLFASLLMAGVQVSGITHVSDLWVTPDIKVALLNQQGQRLLEQLPAPAMVQDSLAQWLMLDGAAMTYAFAVLGILAIGYAQTRFREAISAAFIGSLLTVLVTLIVWAWAYPSLLPEMKVKHDQIRHFLGQPDLYYAEIRAEYERQLTHVGAELS